MLVKALSRCGDAGSAETGHASEAHLPTHRSYWHVVHDCTSLHREGQSGTTHPGTYPKPPLLRETLNPEPCANSTAYNFRFVPDTLQRSSMTLNEQDHHEQGAVGGKCGLQAAQPIRLKRNWPESRFLTEPPLLS